MPAINRLGLSPLTIIRAAPLEFVDAAAAGGFDFVTLRLVPPRPGDPFAPLVDDPPLLRETRRRLADHGLSVWDVESFWLSPDTDVPGRRAAVETAASLGARYILSVGNDPDEPRLTANFAALCDLCAEFGLGTVLEFIPYCHVRTLSDARRVVARAARPNAGILVDALHLSRSGGAPADVLTLDPALIPYAQLCDAPRAIPASVDALRTEAREGRLYPGQGELWLAALMDALPPGIPIGIEAPCAADAGLPVIEQGRRVGATSRGFLAAYRAARPGA